MMMDFEFGGTLALLNRLTNCTGSHKRKRGLRLFLFLVFGVTIILHK